MPDTDRQTRPAEEVCPHGIALSKFCAELHSPDVNVVKPGGVGTCPHGITLNKFCTQLHTP